ncbi:MAG: ABC transporter permease [Acidobacteriota bacterium]
MLGYGLRRLGASLLLLWLVLTGTFFLIHLAPGEPAVLFENRELGPEQRQALEALYGFDQPLLVQYGRWLGGVLRGDWGSSLSLRRPVADLILERLGPTILLVGSALVLEHLAGLPLGLLAARRAGSGFDRLLRAGALLMASTPAFLVGLVLLGLFAVRWPLFPAGNMSSDDAAFLGPWSRLLDLAHHLALPAATLALVRCVGVLRHVRNGLLDVLQQDFIVAARARGLSESAVLWRHALPNVLGPLIQRLGVSLPLLLSGVVVLEVVFSWPGLGTLGYQAILQRDIPLVLAATGFSALLVILGGLGADLAHGWIDPRVQRVR